MGREASGSVACRDRLRARRARRQITSGEPLTRAGRPPRSKPRQSRSNRGYRCCQSSVAPCRALQTSSPAGAGRPGAGGVEVHDPPAESRSCPSPVGPERAISSGAAAAGQAAAGSDSPGSPRRWEWPLDSLSPRAAPPVEHPGMGWEARPGTGGNTETRLH